MKNSTENQTMKSDSQEGFRPMKKILVAAAIITVSGLVACSSKTESPKKEEQAKRKKTKDSKQRAKVTCCAYTMKDGLLGRMRKSSLFVRGSAIEVNSGESDPSLLLKVEKTLVGAVEVKTLPLIADLNDPHIYRNQSALFFLEPFKEGYATIAVLPLKEKNIQAVENTVISLSGYLQTPNAKTLGKASEALIQAYILGGSDLRDMISRDFNKNTALLKALSKTQMDSLHGLLRTMPGKDPALSGLILMIGHRHDHTGTRNELVRCLEKSSLERALPTLIRVMQKRGANEYCKALLSKIENSEETAQKERMSYVIARLNQSEGRSFLAASLNNQASPQMQGEALIAHAGFASELGKSLALDTIRKHLVTQSNKSTAMGKIMKERERTARLTKVPEGERYRLMAAGFYLARMKNEAVQKWLRSKLKFLDNAGVAAFIQDRLTNTWSQFDDPY